MIDAMSAVELVDLSRLQKACLDMEWERHTQYMGEIFFYGQQRLDKRMEAHRKKEFEKQRSYAVQRRSAATTAPHRSAPTLAAPPHRAAPPPPPPPPHNMQPTHSRSAPALLPKDVGNGARSPNRGTGLGGPASGPSTLLPRYSSSDLIPKEVNTKLLPDRITKYLLEMAAAMPEELVVLVEIAPQQSRSLHQSREQYERHLGLLDDLLSDTLLNSLKYPSEVAFRIGKVQECPASLQDEWTRLRRRAAPAVAFDDFRQHAVRMALLTNPKPDPGTRFAADNQLASNQSWKGSAIGRCPEKAAPPLRHGAFEVYLVVQRAGNLRPRVELLFSKLFSRCWPRANAVLGRLRKALDAELRLREDEHVLARVRESNEPAELRAALQELSVLADSPAAQVLRSRLNSRLAALCPPPAPPALPTPRGPRVSPTTASTSSTVAHGAAALPTTTHSAEAARIEYVAGVGAVSSLPGVGAVSSLPGVGAVSSLPGVGAVSSLPGKVGCGKLLSDGELAALRQGIGGGAAAEAAAGAAASEAPTSARRPRPAAALEEARGVAAALKATEEPLRSAALSTALMQEEEQEAAEVRFRHYAVSSLPEQAAAEAAVAVAAQAAEEARAAKSAAVQAAEEARAAKAATELAAEVARAAQEVAELAAGEASAARAAAELAAGSTKAAEAARAGEAARAAREAREAAAAWNGSL